MMMRCFLNTDLNAGFSAMVSARALIIFEPIFMSFAHNGTRPQWKTCSVGWPSGPATTTYTSLVGATL